MPPFKVEPRQFESWSNSRWNDYAECPARANYKHLLKLPEPKGAPMLRGIEIAKQEEDFFLGKSKKMPEVHPDTAKLFKSIMKGGKVAPEIVPATPEPVGRGRRTATRAAPGKLLLVEQNWGFDRDWKPVDYFDWKNCWLRIKVDIGFIEGVRVVHLYDNKTGGADKRTGQLRMESREKYEEQLDLYRAGAAGRFPDAEEFHTMLIYSDLGVTYPAEGPLVSTRAQALESQKAWTRKVQPMFNDKLFKPRPGNYCRWCHFRKSNGGPCRF